VIRLRRVEANLDATEHLPPQARRGRILVGGLVVLLALLTWGAVRIEESHAEVAQARTRLLAGHAAAAARVFERYRGWPFVGRRARAGLALARALEGSASSVEPETAASPEFRSDRSVLLDRAFEEQRAGALGALGALGDPLATVYLAALALDRGDDAEARARLAADPSAFRSRGVGIEVEAVLAMRAQGAVTTVRDRSGRRVGSIDTAGRLVLDETVDAAWIPAALFEALASPGPPHSGLRLSLDLDLAHLAASALAGRRGSIVLLDTRSGAVLAAVSDPRTTAAGGTPAFEQQREPASISKVITTAAALRAGIDPDAAISRMTCTGSERYEGGTLWCTHPAGRLQGLDHALAMSCNVAFANLGVLVGRERLLAELRRWGFDRGDLGLGPSGRIVQAEGNERQLADLSIGLEATDLTPLHAALLAAVIGNEGRMPAPYLLEAEQGRLGLDPRPFAHPSSEDVIDPAWLPVLGRAMEAVSEHGTAAGVAPVDFPVAMKTGTGATWRLGYHANYIGVGPWPEPNIAFCVRITHEPSSSRVTRAARQVLGALLEGLARLPASHVRRAARPGLLTRG
jgi:peptidoglycan glycosyltransferase